MSEAGEQAVIYEVECACGCGDLVEVGPRYAGAACRKRAERMRKSGLDLRRVLGVFRKEAPEVSESVQDDIRLESAVDEVKPLCPKCRLRHFGACRLRRYGE